MYQMSDPLTALMHAVQVMNLLKTLILKVLREREETASEEDYSSYSSSPVSNQQDDYDDEDCGSQKEMDTNVVNDAQATTNHQMDVNMNTSSEITERTLDCFIVDYRNTSDEGDDCMRDIEDCFLKQLEWKEDQTTPLSCSDFNASSCFSSESKVCSSITSYETESESSVTRDVTMISKSLMEQIEEEKEGKGAELN